MNRAVALAADLLSQSLRVEALDGAAVSLASAGVRFTLSATAVPEGETAAPEDLPPRARLSVRLVYHLAWRILRQKGPDGYVTPKEIHASQGPLGDLEPSTIAHALTALEAFGFLRNKRGKGYQLPEACLF